MSMLFSWIKKCQRAGFYKHFTSIGLSKEREVGKPRQRIDHRNGIPRGNKPCRKNPMFIELWTLYERENKQGQRTLRCRN